MKKIIFTLLIWILTLSSESHAQGSVLNLGMTGRYLFTVQLDNQFIGYPNNQFSFNGLNPGNHYLTIYRMRNDRHRQAKLVYNGYVSIPMNSVVNASLIEKEFLRINSITPILPPPVCEVRPGVTGNPIYAVGYSNGSSPSYSTIGHEECYQGPIAMCDAEFSELRRTLDHINFDHSRLDIAEQIVSDKYLTTQQVIELLEYFSFDSSRLEFAKFAYNRTVDQNMYFRTYNSFTFDSSIHELSEYIHHCG